jgi:flagellar L-ring protein precursor FlgH
MKTRFAALPALAASVLLAGCSTDFSEVGVEPGMTPVGSGLTAYHASLPSGSFPDRSERAYHSLWSDNRENLFADSRALKVGDVVTVRIRMADQARLNNATGRSRDSGANLGFDFGGNFGGPGVGGEFGAGVNSGSRSRGQGTIDRSERIDLNVAAVVTNVLPNGNLMISGSQEVRVNYEMRVLNVAGIVRPRDITARNTIDYEKIAEARISYGGRGRSMEVQQPGWGQQVYDRVTPF